MNTEITDKDVKELVGWIFYDSECAFCVRAMNRCKGLFACRGFCWLPSQTPGTAQRLGVDELSLGEEMKVLLADGRVFGGVDAWALLLRSVWWLWPIGVLLDLSGIHWLGAKGYRWVARNRHCINGACGIRRRNRSVDWLPITILPAIVIAMQAKFAPWIFMWILASAIFMGCKWLTWRRIQAETSVARSLAYLFAWPGMDAEKFFGKKAVAIPKFSEWIFAAVKTFAGVTFIWLAARNSFEFTPLLNGWLGMVGIILFLHFGSFHLLALAWQRAGFDAKPLMRAPLIATSLADFWGVRWNTAFHLLAHDLVFRPLARRIGIAWAMLGVFFISGLIRDLVISLPARDGYGLPTAYFLLQGAAILFERSTVGRALGLGRGFRGWTFMFVVTAAPAYWLFHPTFVRNVILPMLKTIGAT